MAEQSLTPDQGEIEQHLTHITRRWHELGEPCVLETRMLTNEDRAQVKDVMRFDPTPEGIAFAAQHIAGMNKHKLNAYVVVNPIKADSDLAPGRAAKDADIAASFFHWADADDKQAADNIKGFVGPRSTFVVLTGTIPDNRPHAYWELEEPTRNLPAWRTTQEAIAATLKTDSTVVNASRIMRVGGTINWPKPQKQGRGYIAEKTQIHIHDPDERPAVSSERMARAFSGGGSKPASGDGFSIPTNEAPPPLDRERTIIKALSGQEWNNAVFKLVGSYVRKGLSDSEIHALTDPLTLGGYTVEDTREEVQGIINRTRANPQFEAVPEITPPAFSMTVTPQADGDDDAAPSWPTPLTDFNENNLPRREWIYGTDYIRKYVSVVASAGGVGKTSQAIAEALSIVTGRALLGVDVKESCKVWIINLEDPEEELRMRALAAMKHYGIPQDQVAGRLFLDGEDTIKITLAVEGRDGLMLNDALLEAMKAKIIENDIGVVIIDPFVSTHMVNENSNASIQAVVAMLRSLTRDTRASVSLVHHTRKGNGEDAGVDSVRGAGSLIGAARAVRVINRISEADAEKLGVPPQDAKGIFRVDDGKANLAPPAESAVYRQMIGVKLDNGEWVGVTVPFELPDEWSGMSDDVVNDMLRQIAAGPARDDDSEEYFSIRPQDKARWVGNVITSYPFKRAEDLKNDSQAKMILRQWLKSNLIEEVEYYSAAQRKNRKGVTSSGRVGAQV